MFKSIKEVLHREWKQMFSRPIYLFGTVLILSFCAIFFFSLFDEGLPNELPIGIVDRDNSSFSRMVRRNLDAEQGVRVVKTYSEYQAARKALQVGDIYGFIDIPNGAYRDILEGRRPKVGIYCEQGLIVPGNLTYKNFIYIGTVLDVGVRREILKAKGYPESGMMARLQPIKTDFHLIKNPWTNYGIYLTTILWPGLLQLCVLLMTVFSIGYELKMKTSRDWMSESHGSIFNALTGKLLPYTFIFVLMGIAFELLACRIMGYPIATHIWVMFLTITLLVFAAQAVGIFMIGLFPVLRDGLSFAALYGILSLSLAGMSFPVEYMLGVIQGWAVMFPLRQFFLIYVKEGIFAAGFNAVWLNYVGLLIFCLLPFTILKRLKRALIFQNYPLK